jgi:type I restriction enzyme, S subunit
MEENEIHIPEGWVKLESIGNLGKIFNGLSGKTKADFGEGEPYIPYVNVFKNSCIDLNEFDLVRVKKGEHQNKILYGDLIFTTSSETIEEVGMTSVYLDKANSFYLNSFCFCFRLNDFNTILPEFARYLFRSNTVRYSITLLGQGSTRYNLSKTRLLTELKILIPETTLEQQSIANILSKTDQAIANTEALIAKYTKIKTGLMQDLLTKGIDENGNVRTELTHEFKDSPLGRIPKEWEVKKLDECINKNTTITYGIVQTFEHIVDGVPVLRTIDLKENGINSVENLLRTKKSISDKYRRTLLLENDIVCNVRASVGDFNIVSAEYVNCNTTRGVARISPSGVVVNKYLVWFLKSHKNEKQMELLIKGTTFIDINIGDLRKICVLLPSKTEQELIADKLDKIQSSFHIYQTELSKLQSIKTGLMQDLLSGKVRVNNLMKETNE